MVASRRNFIFRVSIVFSIAVLLYAAMHLSGNGPPGMEWSPITGEDADRTEFRYLNRERLVNDTPQESSIRNIEESTSAKPSTPAPHLTAAPNKSVSSTASNVDQTINRDKPANTVTSEAEVGNDTVTPEIIDEDSLAESTLTHLQALLQCNERDFEPNTEQRGEFWVLKNYVRAEHGPLACHETVTYTTHAGFEFLDNVQPLVQRWMAPISLAIHAPGSDFAPTVNSIRYLRDCLGNDLVRQFLTFHIFFSYKHIPSTIPDPEKFLATPYNCTEIPPYNVNASSTYMKQKSLLYPVNVARNIARDAALTHFVLPSDIELYPSPNLPTRFLNMIARNAKPLNTSTNPRVFPISIFEVDAKVQVPLSKTELQGMLSKKTAIPFHKYVCPNCHNIPQGQQWMTAKETNQMKVFHVGKRWGKFVHWEPIFIGTHKEPHYDERLSWEGKQDKMTQGFILCVKNYDFMILNNAFLIHKPGIKRYVRNKKRDAIAGKQGAFVRNRIVPELKKLFGTRSGCAL